MTRTALSPAACSGEARCPTCNAHIYWAMTATGDVVALDLASGPHTYQLVVHEGEGKGRRAGTYIAHRLVCRGGQA